METAGLGFGAIGILFVVFGGVVFWNSPAVTQEIAGLLCILIGIVALGFGETSRRLQELAKYLREEDDNE